ncbi:hypothetical protein CSC70_02290 [Pseudoxanthomonas kalamensis DSM 18571]|uniref:ATP-binding protein n=1 Tax=Pseudoxanthomonas kalamensis TaxID=289483 RepID=UPI001391A519|nr:ATP-binding protein [Pseudoxanthomonas kalamensis]KAF1712373.1 hypothetical protein CSC70_02290 [Pseudoxanthomonas kalamensis DSM 18571]
MNASRTVFTQLVLVIALVLLGAAAFALLLGGRLVLRPAADQVGRAADGFATLAEAQLRNRPREEALAELRAAGLEVREQIVPVQPRWRVPLMRELQRMGRSGELGPGRDLEIVRGAERNRLWLKLDVQPAVWIALPVRERRVGAAGRYSVVMLGACAALVWLAAAYFTRRLTRPLRRLATAAPALVRGEDAAVAPIDGPREVQELGAALVRSSREVREAAEERALMLAGISHDLRTPLTRLQYALALLPDSDPELSAGMERDIAEIDAVLSQFIAYARDGRDENSEPLDLAEICRNAVAAGRQSWQVDAPDTAPIRGKPMALLRALENLVTNAERHGAAPFVLSLAREGNAWRVEVADHGPGLPPAMAQRALRPFVHGSGGGSGLGLAIVERVARQHGGDLQLQANAPHGLRAVLRLREG